MKKFTILLTAAIAAIVLAAWAEDIQNRTIRYRQNVTLSFDPNVTIKDEDNNWTMTSRGLKSLSILNPHVSTSLGVSNQFLWLGSDGYLVTKEIGGTNVSLATTAISATNDPTGTALLTRFQQATGEVTRAMGTLGTAAYSNANAFLHSGTNSWSTNAPVLLSDGTNLYWGVLLCAYGLGTNAPGTNGQALLTDGTSAYWGAVEMPALGITNVSSDYTVAPSFPVVAADTTESNCVVTLPAVFTAGLFLQIKNTGTNTLTITNQLGQTIDGGLSIDLTNQYQARTLYRIGTNWLIY